MSQLGPILDLPEGSRLTGISLHDCEELGLLAATTVHLQTIQLSTRSDPTAYVGAISAFLPQAFATMHGNTPEGDGWFAVFLLSATLGEHGPFILEEQAALAPLRRALDLTGVSPRSLRSVPMTEKLLRIRYEKADAEVGLLWGIPDLVLGLLVELTGTALTEVVELAQNGDASGTQVRAPERERLQAQLMDWAATYAGPML